MGKLICPFCEYDEFGNMLESLVCDNCGQVIPECLVIDADAFEEDDELHLDVFCRTAIAKL